MNPLRLLVPALVCALVLASVGWTGKSDSSPAHDPARLDVELSRSRVAVTASVSSIAHEAILRQLMLKQFDQPEEELNFALSPGPPPGWALVTELVLRIMGRTWSGHATVDPTHVEIRAVTLDRSSWEEAAARLRDNLPPGMNLEYEVAEIRPSASFARQCSELFRTATRGRPIEFALSSAYLRTSAYPVLDELIQVAADCPRTILIVTGHTDHTGNESNNVALSQIRAQAVADYLVSGGIPVDRVHAIGVGSSQPIVAGNTRRARQLNRRIELDLEFPESRAAVDSGCPQGVSLSSRPSIPISSTTKTSVEPGAMTGPICRSP